MGLSAGDRVGPYDVTALLGAGGMGVVYRATDSKLGRDVALKVIRPELARDAQYMMRFEREARVLASLNHPNIGAIYGMEESGDERALVMEFVEGPTLADRIKRGRIPQDEAFGLARQIAEAVEYAHEKGVIHRDLKPANIKLTAAGSVKVLDFGLAKIAERAAPAAAGAEDTVATVSLESTQAGQVVGTPAYMSPEQVRGNTVDARTDIWAMGVILFQMLSGAKPFEGETSSDILASVLNGPVDWSALPGDTPANVRVMLRRCLERDVRRRLRDIGDARIELEDAMAAPVVDSARPRRTPVMRRRLWVAAGALLASMVWGVAWWRGMPAAVPAPEIRVERITDSVGNEESPRRRRTARWWRLWRRRTASGRCGSDCWHRGARCR
jgi:serine/threonine protein kinase